MAIYSKDAIVKAGNVILIVKDVKEHVSAWDDGTVMEQTKPVAGLTFDGKVI